MSSAARVAIEAVAQTNPTIPVILLSPFLAMLDAPGAVAQALKAAIG